MAAHPPSPVPPLSALQNLITANPPPQTPPTTRTPHHHNLALQIAHNLHYQHRWTDVRIHHTSPGTNQPLPRALLSGLPPQRLYIHPDEQIEILQTQKDAGRGGAGMPKLASEREWVLPSQLREKWSLRRFGEVFGEVPVVPEVGEGRKLFEVVDGADGKEIAGAGENVANPWRTKMPKRLLLATVDDDSTVVYYIVHDGIVKPRQN